jgi:zinc protease
MMSLQRTLVGFMAAAFVASAASAQQTPPPPGPPRPFQLPTPTTTTLDNGVKMTFVDFGTIPKVTIAITVRTGALNEEGKTWLSDRPATC